LIRVRVNNMHIRIKPARDASHNGSLDHVIEPYIVATISAEYLKAKQAGMNDPVIEFYAPDDPELETRFTPHERGALIARRAKLFPEKELDVLFGGFADEANNEKLLLFMIRTPSFRSLMCMDRPESGTLASWLAKRRIAILDLFNECSHDDLYRPYWLRELEALDREIAGGVAVR
jgi:hypothetical protein